MFEGYVFGQSRKNMKLKIQHFQPAKRYQKSAKTKFSLGFGEPTGRKCEHNWIWHTKRAKKEMSRANWWQKEALTLACFSGVIGFYHQCRMTHTGNYQRSGQARSLWHPSSSDLETGHVTCWCCQAFHNGVVADNICQGLLLHFLKDLQGPGQSFALNAGVEQAVVDLRQKGSERQSGDMVTMGN